MDALSGFVLYTLGLTDLQARGAAIVFLIACGICAALRFLICMAYNVTRQGFNMFVKEAAKKKADPRHIKTLVSPTMTKIIGEYISIGEKGIANIDTRSIVENRVSKLGILGISYLSAEGLVSSFELVSAIIAFVLAFIYNNPQGFGILGIGVFVLLRILAVFLNFNLIRQQLVNDIISYVDREVGQYYIGDVTGAVGRLRIELSAAVAGLGKYFEEAMAKMESAMSANIKTAMDEIGSGVNLTMESLSKYSEYMDEPFSNWKEAVNSAAKSQSDMSAVVGDFISKVSEAAAAQKEMNLHLKNVASSMDVQIESFKKMAEDIGGAANSLTGSYSHVENINAALSSQLEVFMNNQQALKNSMEGYEQSLQSVTGSLADSFGIIIKHHMGEAYGELNSGLKDNIAAIVNSNAQVINKIDDLVDELYGKSGKQMEL